uniref:endoribonuclease YbeY isoform X6 n=1 Tax=Macaca mulatta TaxID=9544 RepID=UPI0005F4E1D5|nr:endoribonuclease YbeY isoform X4 [Macaca nemestrina]XP_014988140.1 endoribonuclease YbeY isoform X6 [Macaca mulatta]XP_015302195.1 endoribonuclease YbeY isoform X4 [Macaca fascicularis]XP_024645722.1 endoribonuclease YbeY isoform X4 [Macaca nemestrina]
MSLVIRNLQRVIPIRRAPLRSKIEIHLKAGEFPLPEFPDDYNLGDIFLGVEYIFHQCKEDEDYNDVLTVTATHGLCHLLGFTHSTEAEWQQMFQKEKAVLDELGRRTGTRLQPLTRDLFGGS